MRASQLALLVAVALGVPFSARADTCPEQYESCIEDCRVEHGMDKDRAQLGRCVKQCEVKKDDCHTLQDEERENYQRSAEPVPEERKAGTSPSYVVPPEEGDEAPHSKVRSDSPDEQPKAQKTQKVHKAEKPKKGDDPLEDLPRRKPRVTAPEASDDPAPAPSKHAKSKDEGESRRSAPKGEGADDFDRGGE